MAAVSAIPVSRPKVAMPRASRMACRRRSRSSCTSTINNSRRFSPTVIIRRAKRFEVAASCWKLTVAASMSGSVAVAGAPARDKIAEERTDTEGDANGLIWMFTHGFVRGFRAFDRFVADTARNFLGAFQRGGETLAGVPDFFSGHIGGGGHQGARIFGERAHVITGCLCMFVHIFFVFGLFAFFNGKFSASSRWAASGELATFRTEFLPPNGLGTVSLASGSGIHWPSTTRQYSYVPGSKAVSFSQRPPPAGCRVLASGCQWLKVPATQTVVAVGWVNSKRTGTSSGPALRTLSWL